MVIGSGDREGGLVLLYETDETDGAGHGVLIATDSIWLTGYINGAVPDIGTTAAVNWLL